jgi:hypothetical protein
MCRKRILMALGGLWLVAQGAGTWLWLGARYNAGFRDGYAFSQDRVAERAGAIRLSWTESMADAFNAARRRGCPAEIDAR